MECLNRLFKSSPTTKNHHNRKIKLIWWVQKVDIAMFVKILLKSIWNIIHLFISGKYLNTT